jgi:hypothetical protein
LEVGGNGLKARGKGAARPCSLSPARIFVITRAEKKHRGGRVLASVSGLLRRPGIESGRIRCPGDFRHRLEANCGISRTSATRGRSLPGRRIACDQSLSEMRMISIRKLVAIAGVLLAVALASASASADNKSFSIAVSPSPLLGTSWTIDVTFTNNANGNSTFNSLSLQWNTSINVSQAALKQNGVTIQPATFTPGGSSAVFTNLSPVKTGKSVVLSLVATSTSAGCSGSSVTWTPSAWTGSPTSPSNVFTAIPLTTTTSINPICSLAFTNPPGAALAGQAITGSNGQPVSVAVLKSDGTPDTSYAGTISLAITPGTGATGAQLNGGGGVAVNASGNAVFPNLIIDKPGTDYRLRASAAPGGFTSVDSAKFSVYSGVLGCTSDNYVFGSTSGNPVVVPSYPLDPDTNAAYVGTPSWALRRGSNWDDGQCIHVDYSFNLDPATNTATFLWDKTVQPPQNAAFKYVILWAPFTVDTSTNSTTGVISPAGWSAVRPMVSWGIVNPQRNTLDFMPALACSGDDLTQGQALLPVIPNVWPFNDPATPTQYRPLDGNGNPQTAKVCIAQSGFTAVGRDTNGNVLVQWWDKVVDEADAVIIRNP